MLLRPYGRISMASWSRAAAHPSQRSIPRPLFVVSANCLGQHQERLLHTRRRGPPCHCPKTQGFTISTGDPAISIRANHDVELLARPPLPVGVILGSRVRFAWTECARPVALFEQGIHGAGDRCWRSNQGLGFGHVCKGNWLMPQSLLSRRHFVLRILKIRCGATTPFCLWRQGLC